MAGYLTSSTLIDEVVRSAAIPINQETLKESDLLAFANQEMRIGLVPSILTYHQEYFARDSDPIALVANQSRYQIPYRAIGGKFREVFYQDTQGNLRSMTRISPDDRPYYQQSSFQNNFVYFYIEGNDIVITPDVSQGPTGSILFSYFLRPNELVDESRVATIANMATDTVAGTTTYTVDQIPTGFGTSVELDILQTRPGHRTWDLDIIPISINTTNKTITFTTTDISANLIIVGDYIAFAGECIIPQVPADLHDVLAQRVTARCMQAQGDQSGLQAANIKLTEMEIKTGSLIDNRSEGQSVKAVSQRGLLKSAAFRKRGW